MAYIAPGPAGVESRSPRQDGARLLLGSGRIVLTHILVNVGVASVGVDDVDVVLDLVQSLDGDTEDEDIL